MTSIGDTKRTNLVTNPRAIGSTGLVNVRTNFVTNPNFETNTTGWLGAAGAVIVRDAVEKYSGTASLKVTTPGVALDEGAFFNPIPAAVVAGDKFSGSVWVKYPLGVQGKLYLTSSGTGGNTAQTIFTGTGVWQYVKAENATVGTNLNPYILIRTTTTINAITFWVDESILEKGSTIGSYFDGSTAAAGDFTYAWAGTVSASSSYQQAPNVTGYTANNLIYKGVQGSGWAAKTTVLAGGYFISAIGTSAAGKFYSARVTINGPVGITVNLRLHDGTTFLNNTTNVVLTGVPTEYVLLGTTAATSVYAKVIAYPQTAGLVTMTNVLIEQFDTANQTPRTYFDGSSSGAVWSGTPDASASTRSFAGWGAQL